MKCEECLEEEAVKYAIITSPNPMVILELCESCYFDLCDSEFIKLIKSGENVQEIFSALEEEKKNYLGEK